jgi:hypothetical protein
MLSDSEVGLRGKLAFHFHPHKFYKVINLKFLKVLFLSLCLLALVPQPALAQESAAAGLIRRSNAAIPNLYAGKTTATPAQQSSTTFGLKETKEAKRVE